MQQPEVIDRWLFGSLSVLLDVSMDSNSFKEIKKMSVTTLLDIIGMPAQKGL